MKKIILLLSLFLVTMAGFSQATSVADFRIANATTTFDQNLPVGTKVYDINTGNYWVANTGVASTATLTTGSASFDQLNGAGGTDDQNLSLGTRTGTTMDVNIEGGTNVILLASNTTQAGLMTEAQFDKLAAIAAGAEVNLTSLTEDFEEDDGTATAHTLSQTAVTAQGARVSINGDTLKPADYTFATGTITIGVPVSQYDQVVITYFY